MIALGKEFTGAEILHEAVGRLNMGQRLKATLLTSCFQVGLETTPIDKWASVVIEMFNLENSKEFDRIADTAISGADDGDTYATKCVRLEFAALVKTNKYFAKNPLPANAHGIDEWYLWVTASLGTFEHYQRSFDVPGSTGLNSNFAYFKEYYETTLVPFKDATRKAK